MSQANDIAEAIATRLATITTVNGYATNIGGKVLRGRRRLDKSHLPCAVVIERDDEVKAEQVLAKRVHQAKVACRLLLEGHAECDADNPNVVGHQIIADIKKAIFGSVISYGSDDAVLGIHYAGRSIAPREDGTDVVAAAVEVMLEFVETLSDP